VALAGVPRANDATTDFSLLFSESPSRFVLEVRPACWRELALLLAGLPLGRLGEVSSVSGNGQAPPPRLTVLGLAESVVIDATASALKTAWQRPLDWS
jgi:hypothetical protein